MVNMYTGRTSRIVILMVSFTAALSLLFGLNQVTKAAPLASDLSNSSKTVDQAEATVGETVQYTVVVSNTGGDVVNDNASVVLTDELPSTLTLITDTVMASDGEVGATGNTITWTGAVLSMSSVVIEYEAVVNETAVISEMITNTVLIGGSDISGTLDVISRTAETLVVEEPAAMADLSASTKTVNQSEADAGEMVTYSIMVSNSATLTDAVSVVTVTDMLPAGVSYEDGTLTYTMGSGMYSSGVITWTGTVSPSTSATISFMATLSESLSADEMVTNTAEITGTNSGLAEPLVRTATTTVGTPAGPTTIYLPYINRGIEQIEGLTVTPVDRLGNAWDLSWEAGIAGVEYELQESTDPNFASFVTHLVGTDTTTTRRLEPSFKNIYYYRVRGVIGNQVGPWSDAVEMRGIYWDDFDDDSSGWMVVRRDYGSTEKRTYYDVADGESILNVRVGGRWDYQISSSLAELPPPPWRIQTRVRLWDQSNLHAYGFAINGNYNPTLECPDPDYRYCFDQYYRLLVTWYGANSTLRTGLKRIEFHDGKNLGRGDEIGPTRDVPANSPSQTWQDWKIERTIDGRLLIYINDVLIYDVLADRYVERNYFGFFAATDEYAGLDMQIDYVRITPLD